MAEDLYARVTQTIITQLEAGVIPWTTPWQVVNKKGIAYVPMNVATGHHYSGINALLLWAAALERGYRSHSWMTMRQANMLGAFVRKGEHGCPILYTNWVEDVDQKTGNAIKKAFAKRFTAFHVEQLENLPQDYLIPSEPPPSDGVYDEALRLITDCGMEIRYDGTKAYYTPSVDRVTLPPYSWFESPEEFYGVAFHEIIHATGHPSRLNRDLSKRFGTSGYAFEELVAELGSAFLCAHAGIAARHRSASYVENWLTVMKDDKRAVFNAAAYSGRAANWVRSRAMPADEAVA